MLHITPDMLVAMYEFLRTTPPFRGWRLPDSDEITFRVTRSRAHTGCLITTEGSSPAIEVSSASVATLNKLAMVLAHEMIHLHEYTSGETYRAEHGKGYRRRARRVCAIHCFDPMDFGGLE